ncbi:Argininosuccinate lyase [Trinorchestia longiramus]|nr:Argininosuccinate lyase [Trinorchestia longiramus]
MIPLGRPLGCRTWAWLCGGQRLAAAASSAAFTYQEGLPEPAAVCAVLPCVLLHETPALSYFFCIKNAFIVYDPLALMANSDVGPEGGKLWGGRFSGAVDPVMEKFNCSLQRDKIMFKEDIQGSVAYSRALEKAGLLTPGEGTAIRSGLELVLQEWLSGTFVVHHHDEDIHTANERRLKALVSRSEDTKHIITVGYTHLQRAQPVRFAHWLLSFAWWLREDLGRLQQCHKSTDQCPLGSGALAGTPFCVDRAALAADLGFSRVMSNSIMAVADRDFVADYLYFATMLCTHLSRLAEDMSLYCSSEFGIVQLSDAYSTGSSLMPQKKNPDSVELVRGKTGSIIGRLTGFLCVLKGLPSTYNKDLQEDKEALFEVAATLTDLVQVMTGVINTMQVNEKACRSALSENMLATDIAYYLVRKGMAFRDAHSTAGEVVKLSEQMTVTFSQLPLSALQKISPLFADDVSSIWSFESSVEQYSAEGGTSLAAVSKQLQQLSHFLTTFSLDSKQ